MSTPSLLNIPYLYKAGTLYSQIPESGAGDFTVSRTTTVANRSTRINSLGNIEIVNDNVPRLDYPLGGAVNGCPALLVEPSATNSFIESQTLFTTHLVQNLTTTGYTNAATSPDGSVTAEKFVPNTTNGVHGIANGSSLAITSGTTYTLSLFVKSDGGPYNLISLTFDSTTAWGATRNCIFNASNGTNFAVPSGATMTSENYGNGWYRIRATLTAVGTVAAATFQYRIYVTDASGGLSWAAPSGNTNGIFCWGAQLEVGSVPTSYIPTTTAAVTRSAEVISDTTATALIGQTEGTIYAEIIAFSGVNTSRVISTTESAVPTNNRVLINIDPSHRLEAIVRSNGSITNGSIGSSPATLLVNGINKIAYAYNGVTGSNALAINGSVVATNSQTFAFTQALSRVNVALSEIDLITVSNQRIRALELHPNRIPNTAAPGVLSLATLTAL
jgi:hypothetical protein